MDPSPRPSGSAGRRRSHGRSRTTPWKAHQQLRSSPRTWRSSAALPDASSAQAYKEALLLPRSPWKIILQVDTNLVMLLFRDPAAAADAMETVKAQTVVCRLFHGRPRHGAP
ncbi:uncharacterized protein LOC119343061 isoform X1 [Triticum dicoccoides]|uniref:uncharacterized protein LOC119343061 isoform X1 n=1 Tax=Triticum dicoccoides TaxID=85692 RepID=UPI00188FAF2B|nr:uncharacterized protein LOC119343061 isoform X1 [Triticum dicoccoides]